MGAMLTTYWVLGVLLVAFKLSLASFARSARVERGREVLRFVPERNWIVARHRGQRGNLSLVLVRIDVSWAEGGLLMRARFLPLDIVWLPFAVWWLSSSNGFARSPVMMLVILVGGVAAFFFGERSVALESAAPPPTTESYVPTAWTGKK